MYLIFAEDFLKHKKASNLENVVQLSSELIVWMCLVPLWFQADGGLLTLAFFRMACKFPLAITQVDPS